jgi:hypothetical protein
LTFKDTCLVNFGRESNHLLSVAFAYYSLLLRPLPLVHFRRGRTFEKIPGENVPARGGSDATSLALKTKRRRDPSVPSPHNVHSALVPSQSALPMTYEGDVLCILCPSLLADAREKHMNLLDFAMERLLAEV